MFAVDYLRESLMPLVRFEERANERAAVMETKIADLSDDMKSIAALVDRRTVETNLQMREMNEKLMVLIKDSELRRERERIAGWLLFTVVGLLGSGCGFVIKWFVDHKL